MVFSTNVWVGVTLATFLMLTGLNLALTRLIGGSVSSPSISNMDGFESRESLTQWNPDWFKFFLGVMLLLATIVNLIVKRRAELK